jgi:hypothetical protein
VTLEVQEWLVPTLVPLLVPTCESSIYHSIRTSQHSFPPIAHFVLG